ncbi:MAG TPA: hypothetical protein DCG69_01085 [Bacteroidales bacterium]|nr:hypothetical protein [Bacteroidales bacterium]
MNRLLSSFPKDYPQLSTQNFVSWHDVDFKGHLSLPAMFNFTQETAWKHAEEIGLGFEKLGKQNLAWVLFGIRIKVMNQWPTWQDRFTIETQPKGISGMFANRDYRMLNAQNELIAIGSSNWVIIEIDSRRPQRLDHHFSHLRFVDGSVNLIERLKLKEEFPHLLSAHKVKSSDIDLYGHVNNAKYISWLSDLYTPDQLANHPLDEILINFVQETRFGEEIEIYSDRLENSGKVKYKMQRKSDYRTILLAEIDWN